jgi:integrase
MPAYVKPHSSGSGWVYQRAVPKWLRSLFGKPHFFEYIKAPNRREAENAAQPLAARDAAVVRFLEGASENERQAFMDDGGLPGLRERVAALQQQVALHAPWQRLVAPVSAREAHRVRHVLDADAIKAGRFALLQQQADEAAQLEAAKATLLKAEPAPEFSIDGLFRLWTKTGPKETRHYARAAKLLGQYLGDVDFRDVKAKDMHDFPEWMVAQGVKATSSNKNLDYVKGMFSAVMPKHRDTNPAHGVRKLDEGEKDTKKPFTGAQLHMIFDAVAGLEWGNARHDDVWWIMRLCLFTGCRPNEAAQLQRGDIYTQGGIQVIHFRQADAVTGRKHPQKSIKTSRKRKNAGARQFPLAPALGEFYAWATKGPPDEFVFHRFGYGKTNKRASWLINRMPHLLDDLGMKDNALTLYSLRHSFIRARRKAGISQEIGEILDGHRNGIEGGYGDGIDLSDAFAAVCKINPLGLD